MLYTPLYMQAAEGDDKPEYTGLLMRLGITGVWASEGVTSAASLKVRQRADGANMSVDVAGGIAVITGNDVNLQGTYMVVSDAVENVTVPAAPGAGTQTHRIVAWVKDKLYDGTLAADTYEWTIELLEDEGAGLPDPPDSAVSLAFVTVAAGQISVTDSDIQDVRISALTKPSWLAQIASASTRPAVPLTGERIWRTDLACQEVYDGSAWREVPRRDGGGSAWTTYTPALTGTTTSPTLGSSPTIQGRYIREGRTVTCEVIIKFGLSGTAAGSGIYEVSLPVTARLEVAGRRTGSAYTWDNSAGDFADGVCFIDSAEQSKVRMSIDSGVVRNNIPWTWAASDEMGFTITYEAAS